MLEINDNEHSLLKKILKKATHTKSSPTLEDMEITIELIEEVYDWANMMATYGELASYIPELCRVDSSKSAIAIGDLHTNIISVGSGRDVIPSIQSVVKPFLYIYALEQGVAAEKIAGIEATASSFNTDRILSPELQEKRAGHPLNNAGAISSAGAIEDFRDFLNFMRILTGNPKLSVLEDIYESEMDTNSNNRAIAYRLVASGRFDRQEKGIQALENYTKACAVGVNTEDAVRACLVVAYRGRREGKRIIEEDNAVRAINAMNSYGLYEHTGEISLLASGTRAISCKSGVGGLIINIDPGRGAFCTYGPLLDDSGNSVFGKYALVPLNNILAAPDAMRLSADEIIRSINKDRKGKISSYNIDLAAHTDCSFAQIR